MNNTFGRTVNPLNRKVTSGGSSGGESALIAFGGSPLGVGTDIVASLSPSMKSFFLTMYIGRQFTDTSSMYRHLHPSSIIRSFYHTTV